GHRRGGPPRRCVLCPLDPDARRLQYWEDAKGVSVLTSETIRLSAPRNASRDSHGPIHGGAA
ncbi:MAG: hypothetical protein VYD05_12340, partial [Planctomycetota bacterium]|nr:hypothetical protein [Planctomycetota bacterium]